MVDIVNLKKNNKVIYPVTHEKSIIYDEKEMVLQASGIFVPYGMGESKPIILKVGSMVELYGAYKNTVEIPSGELGNVPKTIVELPLWAKPRYPVRRLVQSSHTQMFWLSVDYVGGRVLLQMARYRSANSEGFTSCPANSYLTISCNYIV